MKKNRIMILTIVVIILGIYTCVIGINSKSPQNTIAGEELELSATDMDGNQVDNSILKGKELTIVYIWSATCEECTDGLEDLVAIVDEYGDELKVVGLVTDTNADEVNKLIFEKQITFSNFIMGDESKDFIFTYFYDIPLILFTDSDGVVLEPYIEGMANYDDIKYIIDVLTGK